MLARCITAIGLLLFAGCTHDPLAQGSVYPGLVEVEAPQGELVPVLFSAAGTPAQQGLLYVAMHDAALPGRTPAWRARRPASRRSGPGPAKYCTRSTRRSPRRGRQEQRHRRGLGRFGLRPAPFRAAHDRGDQGMRSVGAALRRRCEPMGRAPSVAPRTRSGARIACRRLPSRRWLRRTPSSSRSCASWTRWRPPSTMACPRRATRAAVSSGLALPEPDRRTRRATRARKAQRRPARVRRVRG